MKEKKQNWYTNQKKYHFIYKTTCSVNGKFYYGMHSTNNLDDGYIGSGTYLAKAIRRHGRENFSLEIIEQLPSREALKQRERELITEEILKDPMCMNLRLGGGGGWDHCNKPGSWQGRGNLSNPTVHAKTVEKMTQTVKQRRQDAEYDLAYRTARVKAAKCSPGFTGHQHSIETKKLMSEVDRTGTKNSQFGVERAWVNKLGKRRRIRRDQLQEFLDVGWSRGWHHVV